MIPFLDLRAQYLTIKDEIDAAILNLLPTTHYTLGSAVAAFEEAFAAYCHTTYAIGVNSGTSALHLALLAAGVGPGDEVVTVSSTFVATAAAVIYAGATPVLVDIDPTTYTLNPALLEAAITEKTKAIVPVHLYGHPADMDPIMDIVQRYGLVMIEDAAQAHGATYKGRPVGSIGHLSCFSFYPGKNLGAYGEGGVILTNNSEYNRTLRMLRDWGQERKYHHDLLGFNYRMEGIQGAVLSVKLKHLPAWTAARRANAAIYNKLLQNVAIDTPQERPDCSHVYHIFAVQHSQRSQLQQALLDRGIHTAIHYPIPVHLQKAYAPLCRVVGELSVTERFASSELSLPMFPELTAEQIDVVCGVVREYIGT